MKKTPLQTLTRIVSVASLFVFSGVIVFALQTAVGWTNPNANPPSAAGALYYSNNNVGIYTTTPTSTLSVNGEINAMGNKVIEVGTPSNGKDAVNLDYLQNYVSAQGVASGTGGGSVVIYYRTISNVPAAIPSCPAGWNQSPVYTGYGPHYIGVFAHDWFNQNVAGNGGGFPNTTNAPPSGGANYVLRSVAIGSDSVCSQSPTSTVPFVDIYNNVINANYTKLESYACATSGGVTECNRCIVCER